MSRIGFIGGGNMAEALIKAVLFAELYKAEEIIVSDIVKERLSYLEDVYAVQAGASNAAVAGGVDILILSIKPQQMEEALESIKDSVKEDTLVISIAAGVKTGKIASVLGDKAIIRVMPNTPALISEGAAALYATEKAKSRLEEAKKIFDSAGKAVVVEDEGLMDTVTAVSGSGPAYFFLLIEEMIKSGVELGLSEEMCRELVLQTAKGASMLACEGEKRGEGPGELRRKVTSPGGTTEAALKVFSDGSFGALVLSAVKRAYERSRELSG